MLKKELPLISAFALIFASLLALQLRAQSQPNARFAKFTYDVASIKPHPANLPTSGVLSSFNRPNYGISAVNVSILWAVENAYDVEESRISGVPGWMKSETYDIEARVDPSTVETLEKLAPSERDEAEKQMLQALLADRTHLAVHIETRQMQVYELTVAKNGLKLLPGDPSQVAQLGINWSADANGNNRISAKAATTDAFARFLGGHIQRFVLNKTGLTGRYEFTLSYFVDPNRATPSEEDGREPSAPAPPSLPGATGRSLFSAIQEQLGLKLTSAKGPVEVIVIDHVERPDKN